MTSLIWTGGFVFPDMVKINSPGDGSCLIHSLFMAYNTDYRNERRRGIYTPKRVFVLKFREELANLLSSPVDPLNPEDELYYNAIARGELIEISKQFPKYTLVNMQKTLRDGSSLDYMFFEPIANKINKDIYILDAKNKDVLITGEEDLYQKNRPSIVIIYESGHYDLVGIKNNYDGSIGTVFSPDDDFITSIRARQSFLSSNR